MLILFIITILPCTSTKHNILHIISDDLRPELGAYGLTNRHTPNLDQIAATGTTFLRTYAQQAVCGPSRNSFLSGRRPDRSRSWNFINHFRQDHPNDWTSLPGIFNNDPDFISIGAGKAYHPKLPPAYDGNKSWSSVALQNGGYKNPCWNTADNPNNTFQDGGLPCFFCKIDLLSRIFPKLYNTTVANEFCTVDAYEDELSVMNAIQQLKQVVAQKNKYFYLAVGMHKPHLPWQASVEDFNQHPLSQIKPAKYQYPPKNVPAVALQYTEHEIHESPYDPIQNQSAILARRAYRATITGMDRKLRPLLDELKRLNVYNNTAIVFHSDHGWHLGEQGEWRKFTNFEIATKVPLIVSVPWITNQISRTNELSELIDVYPTIVELSGVINPIPDIDTIDGISLVPMLTNETASVKKYALSQYPRRVRKNRKEWDGNSIIHHARCNFTHMGYTIRTKEWRYTEWTKWNGTLLLPIWNKVWNDVVNELYDHHNEILYPINFDSHEENINVVNDFVDVARNMSKLVRNVFPSKKKIIHGTQCP